MARQLVDIGFNNNDGTGDRLRDAMRKINENFAELYQTTASETNVAINNSAISVTELNGNLVLDPNGTGSVIVTKGLIVNTDNEPSSVFMVEDIDGTSIFKIDPLNRNATFDTETTEPGFFITGNTTITGETTIIQSNIGLGSSPSQVIAFGGRIASHIIPTASNNYDLGSATNRWGAIYANTVALSNLSMTNANVANLITANLAEITTSVTVGNLILRTNEIVNSVVNQNIDIRTLGTGIVYIPTGAKIGDESSTITTGVLSVTETTNAAAHVSMQNFSSGTTARGGFLATNDIATNQLHVGINSTNYDNPSLAIHNADSSFVYNTGGDLFIGTASSSEDVILHAGGTGPGNIVARLKANKMILGDESPSAPSDTGELLQVNGDVKITGELTLQGRELSHTDVSDVSTSSYTLQLGDAEDVITRSNTVSGNVVIPTNSNVPFPIGTTITVLQMGIGDLTWTAQPGVTVRSRDDAFAFRGQYAAAAAIKIGTNEWVVTGDVT